MNNSATTSNNSNSNNGGTGGSIEYAWIPTLLPTVTEDSDFDTPPALSNAQTNYDRWLKRRIKRLQKSNPKPIVESANTTPPEIKASDVQVDCVIAGTNATKFEVAAVTRLSSERDLMQECILNHLATRDQATHVCTFQVPREFFFDENLALRPSIAERLVKIQAETATELTFLGDNHSNSANAAEGQSNANAFVLPLVTVQITGNREDVHRARMLILIKIDTLCGMHEAKFDRLPLRHHYVFAGPDGANLKNIMREFGTKIYLPSPHAAQARLPPTSQPGWELRLDSSLNTIYITGSPLGVERTKIKLMEASKTPLISSTLSLSLRKMCWVVNTQMEHVSSIMRKCGVFIAMPPVGSEISFVTMYGSDRQYMEKAASDLAALATQYHEIIIHMTPTTPATSTNIISTSSSSSSSTFLQQSKSKTYAPRSRSTSSNSNSSSEHEINSNNRPSELNNDKADLNKLLPDFNEFLAEIGKICESTGAEVVVCTDGTIGIFGHHTLVEAALPAILNSRQLQLARNQLALHTNIVIEIPQKYEEFVRGKHNGKIKKLVMNTNVQYSFGTSITETNVAFTLTSSVRNETAHAYSALCMELPVEMSMYIPEQEHHGMIGEQGKNSQKIGMRYHAFLRFSNRIEQSKLCGYFKLKHNVFALTPSKYAKDLPRLRDDVVELYCDVCKNSKKTAHQQSQLTMNLSNMSSQDAAHPMILTRNNWARGMAHMKTQNPAINNAAPSVPQTVFETYFPLHGARFLLPKLKQIERTNGTIISLSPPESGCDLIVVTGTHKGIRDTLLEIFATQPKIKSLVLAKAAGFDPATFEACMRLLNEHASQSCEMHLSGSHSNLSPDIVIHISMHPSVSDQELALTEDLLYEYLAEQKQAVDPREPSVRKASVHSEALSTALSNISDSKSRGSDSESDNDGDNDSDSGSDVLSYAFNPAMMPRLSDAGVFSKSPSEVSQHEPTVADKEEDDMNDEEFQDKYRNLSFVTSSIEEMAAAAVANIRRQSIRSRSVSAESEPADAYLTPTGGEKTNKAVAAAAADALGVASTTQAPIPCLEPNSWKDIGSRKPRLSLLLSSPSPSKKRISVGSKSLSKTMSPIARPAEAERRQLLESPSSGGRKDSKLKLSSTDTEDNKTLSTAAVAGSPVPRRRSSFGSASVHLDSLTRALRLSANEGGYDPFKSSLNQVSLAEE